MKRLSNIYANMCSMENLILADKKARKGKSGQYGVRTHDKQRGCNLINLHNTLMEKTFKTSCYKNFKLFDPKERDVSGLPYYPDRIVHHAIMQPLETMFTANFTADTYSCIKGKGIHALQSGIKKALKDIASTTYFLKLDVKKFYPNIDHEILKQLLKRKIKDADLLWLLNEIISSAPGVPIGNYLSQYFANFYLSYFDHWIKEVKKVKYYFRYADDMIILGDNKPDLHQLRFDIKEYLNINLKLSLKHNYQVNPVDDHGIDIGGYVSFHTHTLLRKTIKKNMARIIAKGGNPAAIAAYMGWAMHCNSRNLIKKLNEKIQRVGDIKNTYKLCG